ncbi:hypothetical protein OE88DRAFT_1162056 [Heliocybe sulcata]|uniref:Uncharacterized protein n=1 Tax=Heliocybe sulcata TaxID=5364 RepID=A0A5C3NKQ0_9AGAM|nr:hypothetical protein OE88DRAFT_1162056 [Heliocybe sulcata]
MLGIRTNFMNQSMKRSSPRRGRSVWSRKRNAGQGCFVRSEGHDYRYWGAYAGLPAAARSRDQSQVLLHSVINKLSCALPLLSPSRLLEYWSRRLDIAWASERERMPAKEAGAIRLAGKPQKDTAFPWMAFTDGWLRPNLLNNPSTPPHSPRLLSPRSACCFVSIPHPSRSLFPVTLRISR